MIDIKKNQAIGSDALEFMESVLTPEEIRESNLRVNFIGEIIKARNEKGISQRKLEEMSGIKQPMIARIESGINDPQLSTVLKILSSLGKTLKIVSLEKE